MLNRTCLPNLEQDVDGFACLVCPNHGWAYEILEEGTLSGRCKTRPGVVQRAGKFTRVLPNFNMNKYMMWIKEHRYADMVLQVTTCASHWG